MSFGSPVSAFRPYQRRQASAAAGSRMRAAPNQHLHPKRRTAIAVAQLASSVIAGADLMMSNASTAQLEAVMRQNPFDATFRR